MSATKCIFITGTDTDCGKTVSTKALLETADALGLSTVAYKPIAAGCEFIDDQLQNSDALTLQKNSSLALQYSEVNPIAFEAPIAPHIAAFLTQTYIDFNVISCGLRHLKTMNADLCFIEGAGGWRLPIDNERYLSDWVIDQKLDVILVVGMKLGCLNHAVLTYQSILQDGLNVIGWVANSASAKMPYYHENLTTLNEAINAPLIAEISYLDNIEDINLTEHVNHAAFSLMIEQ